MQPLPTAIKRVRPLLIIMATTATLAGLAGLTGCQNDMTAKTPLQTSPPSNPSTSSIATPINIGEKQWELAGFEQPESIIYDAVNRQYLVSNISGTPTELNGKGFISRVSSQGNMLEKHWVTGLNAPKGMALQGQLLFVADMQQLHVIDSQTGDIVQTLTVPESQMLNDITIDRHGMVYVSDLLGGGIYRLDSTKTDSPYRLTEWIAPEVLPHSNGVLVDGDELLVATWGEGMQADFSTEVLGGLQAVNLHTGHIRPLAHAQQFGNLDGLVKVGDTIFINDWLNGNLYRYHNQQLLKVMQAEKTTADIGTDGQHLLLPVMMQDKVISYGLTK